MPIRATVPVLAMSAPRQRLAARDPGDEVPSPCVSVCAVDPAGGYCLGCFRTLDEIASWIDLDSMERLAVWDRIAERRKTADDPDTNS
jgi:predicted Fe-S protein YdhL (DUF1289 family)